MKKVSTTHNLALKTLEIVSVSKQNLYILNQKELKLLGLKNPDCSPFSKKVDRIHNHIFLTLFFSFLEKE